jgi:hypothetical protein
MRDAIATNSGSAIMLITIAVTIVYGADRANRQIALRMGNDNAPPQNSMDEFVM